MRCVRIQPHNESHNVVACLHSLQEEKTRERHEGPLRIFAHEESSSSSYYGCENSSTQSDLQCGTMPTFLAREEEVETLKEETLGDYLQKYESQSRRFKEHLSFQEFCQLKEDRRLSNYNRIRVCKHHTLGRIFLPTFDGSPQSSANSWVRKIDTYF